MTIENFVPDPELLSFAKEFSDTHKELSAGEYFSDNRKFHIRYTDNDESNNSLARTEITTGLIEIYKPAAIQFTSDFIFYIILWCAIRHQERKEEDDIFKVDKIAVDYYLTTGRSKKNLAMGHINLFRKVSTELNKERYNIIEQMLTLAIKPNEK